MDHNRFAASRPGAVAAMLALAALARLATARPEGPGRPALVALALTALVFALEWGAGRESVRRLARWAVFLLTAYCLLCGALFDLEKIWRTVSAGLLSPYPLDPMEGREAVKAWLLRQGTGIYSDLSDYPYLVTLYGPIYYLVLSACPGLKTDPLLTGRLISLACYGLAGLACVVRCLRSTRSALAATAVALVLLGFPLYGWEYAVKPDMLAWLAALAGLFLLDRTPGEPGPGWRAAALAGACFAVAAFTKLQTAVAPAAALAWLLLTGRFAAALRVGAALALVAGAFFAAAQALTGGRFAQQTLAFPAYFSRLPEFNSYAVAAERFGRMLGDTWPLVLAAGLGIVARGKARTSRLLEICLALFCLSAFVALKWYGSASNNFIGLVFMLCLLAGELVGRLPAGQGAGRAVAVLLLVALAGFPARFAPDWERPAPDRQAYNALRALPGLTDKPLLASTEAASPYIGLAAAQSIRLFDAFELAFFDGFSGFDFLACRVADDIRNRRVGFIVDDRPVAPAAFRHLTRTYYEPHSVWNGVPVFAPRPGDVLAVTSLSQTQNHGESSVTPAGAANVRQNRDVLEPQRPGETAYVQYALSLRPGAAEVRLRFFPGILGLESAVRAEVSVDGERWTPWFAYDTVIGFNEQFWGDWPREERLTPPAGRFFVRLGFSGAARLWLSPGSPMAFFVP